MAKTTLYTLVFEAGDEPVVFYVGHTNNADRRWNEHINNAFNENHSEYDTYKYRWIRSLKDAGIECSMVVLHDIEDDDDTEYEWILKFARANEKQDIRFYDGYPLTNMKAGDLLGELIDLPYINNKEDITRYRLAKQHTITYTKSDGKQATGFTVKGQAIIAELQRQADASRAQRHRETIKKITQRLKQDEMLASPEREERLKRQTIELLHRELLEKAIEWQEHNQRMYDEHGGYEAWTETPPQLLKRKDKK